MNDRINPFIGVRRRRGGINRGLHDLAIKQGEGAGYTVNKLTDSFGDPTKLPNNFIALYTNTNDDKKYLITVSDGTFKGIVFAAIS